MPGSDSSAPAQCTAPTRSLPDDGARQTAMSTGVADKHQRAVGDARPREPADEQVLIEAVADEAEAASRDQSRRVTGAGVWKMLRPRRSPRRTAGRRAAGACSCADA